MVCPAATGSGNAISQIIAIFLGMNGRLRCRDWHCTGYSDNFGQQATVANPSGLTDPDPSNNSSTITTVTTAPIFGSQSCHLEDYPATVLVVSGQVLPLWPSTRPGAANGGDY